MQRLVSLVFDVVGGLSLLLERTFSFVSRGDSDAAAAMVITLCLLLIVCCHEMLVRRSMTRVRARRIACVAAGALLVFVGLLHAGTRVTPLVPEKIQAGTGNGFRYQLSQNQADELAKSKWLMIAVTGRFSPQAWVRADSRMRLAGSVAGVTRSGEGRYFLKGKTLYFSSPNGSDPMRAGASYRIVREKKWFTVFRASVCVMALVGALGLVLHRGAPWLRRGLAHIKRERGLLAALGVFVVFFGCHQWRFISQDSRQQMVTSRDDDGYMFKRLQEAAEQKTMDPWKLNNLAYGAVGFYPLALMPYAAAHLGVTPSVEALNLHARGLKVVLSAGFLAAVWLLGARHFGRAPAIAAVLLTATNLGFLSYSSFPFYPDVFMAMFSTLSLCFLLDLAARWSARAFFLAVACAAMSVSVKFLTFLLFPFIGVIALLALWREHRGRSREFAAAVVRNGLAAGVLCVAIFFLCNPYLEYNSKWIVPNYKLCGSLYSAETPNFVAGAAARVSTWLDTCYRVENDPTDMVFAALALVVGAFLLVRLTGACAGARRSHWKWPAGAMTAACILLLFAVAFQAYLFRTVTLSEGIDSRLLIPVYPVLYVVAVWGVAGVLRKMNPRDAAT